MSRCFPGTWLVKGFMLALLLLFVVVLPAGQTGWQHLATGPSGSAAAVQPSDSDKLIIAFANTGLSEPAVAADLARYGLELEQWLPELGLARARVRAGADRAAAAALDGDPAIDYVTEERTSVQVADTPQDEYWGLQWGPAKVGLPAARDITWGDASVVIAVVDTGVKYMHWDLRDQMWINPGESEFDPVTGERSCSMGVARNGQDDDENGYTDDCRGYNFDTGTNEPDDVYGHGTAVAGIAAAATNNPGHDESGRFEGIAGMGGAARIMPLRALNATGAGSPFNIAEAIRYAADQGAEVINLSLTLPVFYNPYDADTLCRATDYAQGKGSVVVAASGNHSVYGVQPVSYPAACPGVLAVGASTRQDTRAIFSDAGPRLDLVAPGEGITTTLRTTNTSYGHWNPNGTYPGSGTSFAAPHAAGAAALLRSLRPDLAPDAVHALLRLSAQDIGASGFDEMTGWGRLDAARAAAQAAEGLALTLTSDPPGAASGSSTQLRIQVRGPGGVPAGLGARIHLAGTLGAISPAVVTADSTGTALATFIAGPSIGAGSATARFGSLVTTIPITVSSGLPVSISLASEPAIVPANGRSLISAALLDEGGNNVANEFDVTFAASLGAVQPATARTVGGKATATFTAGPASGTGLIQASAAGLAGWMSLPVLGAGDPFTATVTADPPVAHAGGTPVTLTATVVDSQGAAVPDGTVVHFTSDRGALSASSATTKAGKTAVKLNPGTVAGTAHVIARAGFIQSAVAVSVVAGPVAQVTVSAEPGELVADYNQLAAIVAVGKDQYGNVASDGAVMQFSTTLGQLVAASAPTKEGRSQVQLIGGLVAGTAQVTATAPGGARGSTSVVVKPGGPAQVALASHTQELTVGAGPSRLQVTVKDAHGNLAQSGIPVTFVTDLGQLRPEGSLAGGATSLVVLTDAGVARADLAPGAVAGTAHVSASVSLDLQQAIEVIIRAGRPAQLLLSAQPMLIRPGGRVDIAAHVSDEFGNPVADGISITFGVTRGQLYQSVLATTDGVAYTWFAAPLTPGPVQVNAIAAGVAGTPVSVQVARSVFLPLVNR